MKVLMFGWEFPPHISGGLGTACYGLTKGLAKNDVEVLFVMPKASQDEDQTYTRIIDASAVAVDFTQSHITSLFQNVSFIEVNSKLIPYVGINQYYQLVDQMRSGTIETQTSEGKRTFSFTGKYTQNLMQEVENYALVAAQIASEYDFDIIHAHDWLTYKAGVAARKISGKPLVVHVHATEFDRSGEHNINDIVYGMERYGMSEADAVCAVSNWTRDIVINKYHIEPKKVFPLHNAVEPVLKEVVRKKYVKEKIVTFLGRVTFQKGPEYFIESAKKILDRDPNVRFVLAGDGDLMHNAIERVAELGISDRFHFTGFLRGAEIDEMFGMSDVYVMPSISEPFGISPLEAMRAYVPVVISKQSGVSEVLTHAIKVDFWDVDAMADAIYGILHYPALATFLGEKGKEDVDNLQWEKVAARLKKIYNQLLNS
ncbi:MAG TPA: glycosyltransferase family 4 protein [Bacteroidales bacterium]|nr:glycosyltransferase family 4 protein [Bacteroidales bacterium]HOH22054.1 glycosyltransferase family 4 protein [Bacteroidales bacterium]HPB57281.1 glycosyltransferase family 4 protein [Bacteroidales bacterium]HPZ03337.1 glycosyltransferase family 4 protein [Bacteroidales bacterium]HQB75084.1 glycosyltransferase family 4 protein [Bacteroidales bacterium]